MIDQGTRLAGRYALREHLGGGGAGDVWLALDESLERTVAVKVLRQESTEDQRRFETEIRAQAPLAHPSIVRVFDVGTHEQRPFLVMAHVDGQALSRMLAAGPLAPEDVARLGNQLADALAHAHGQGVIHRDVKPSNVLVDATGHPYLTDFGIARHANSEDLTATGGFVGSAAYVAPEQAKGETVTAAADIYALGLVLLEALTGRQEFSGSAIEAASARLHRDPHVPAELPAPWPQLLPAMTAADPDARPQAAEVAARLSASPPRSSAYDDTTALAGSATSQLPASPPPARSQPSDADTNTLPPPTDEPRPTGRAQPARRSRSPWPWVAVVAVVAAVLVAGVVLLPGDEPPTTDPGPGGEPATLQQAMDRLQDTIQP